MNTFQGYWELVLIILLIIYILLVCIPSSVFLTTERDEAHWEWMGYSPPMRNNFCLFCIYSVLYPTFFRHILNKSENATLLLLVKMAEKCFLLLLFQFLFCKIKCLMSCYHFCCACILSKWKPKNEIFMCDFILFLKNKIRSIFELEYMCSVFTFLQYTLCTSGKNVVYLDIVWEIAM